MLRESAKVGMMKLCLLIDQNPALYCRIKDHTDLVGSDEPNLSLSIKRAEAVRNYLVESLKVAASRVFTRGFGRYQPVVTSGNSQQQSANRRVEVRMRKTPPFEEQITVAPPRSVVTEEAPAQKVVLVKPLRALLIEEEPLQATLVEEIPSAQSVEEEAINLEPLRAQTVADE